MPDAELPLESKNTSSPNRILDEPPVRQDAAVTLPHNVSTEEEIKKKEKKPKKNLVNALIEIFSIRDDNIQRCDLHDSNFDSLQNDAILECVNAAIGLKAHNSPLKFVYLSENLRIKLGAIKTAVNTFKP